MVINWVILITLGVIWGASFLGVELALTGFGPITLAAGRVSAAALILLVITQVYGDGLPRFQTANDRRIWLHLSLIHISEPTRQAEISYAVFCLKKKKK